MSDQPPRHLTPDEMRALPHSALCDADRVTWVNHETGAYQPTSLPCTCGAGVLKLMVGTP